VSERPGLVPLQCPQCGTPVPAGAEEVAWVCSTCGSGLLLEEDVGLKLNPVHFARGDGAPKPFWVAEGRVTIRRRETYGRSSGGDPRWAGPVRFVLPAFACTVDEAVAWGVRWLARGPQLEEASRGPLEGVTRLPGELTPLAHFVVLTIEADRKDQLEAFDFTVDLEAPQLWVLPIQDA
jgi:hypothetical protein